MTLEALREQIRQREVLSFTVDEVETRFFDQGRALAACHRRGWFYEAGMLAHIARQGRAGAYLDVGANIGNHTVFFAQHCPSTVVHAFEPVDTVHAALVENVALNRLDNVVLHRCGLADETGRVRRRLGSSTVRFDCVRLDDVELTDLAVVKVDIEGMEAAFVRGAVETLRRERPTIYAEARDASDRGMLVAELGQLGYRITGRVFNRSSPTYEFSAAQADGGPRG